MRGPRFISRLQPSAIAAVALLALVLAFLYAIGPARSERTVHHWDPPAAEGARADLVLLAGTPETLTMVFPCGDWSLTTDSLGAGVEAAVEDGSLAMRVAAGPEATVPWTSAACPGVFSFGADGWTLVDAAGSSVAGSESVPPRVGLVEIRGDEAAVGAFSLDLVTEPHGSHPSVVQWVAGSLAILTAITAITLAVVTAPAADRRRRIGGRRLIRFLKPGSLDALVALVVAIWVVIGPAYWDDAYYASIHRAYDDVGQATLYLASEGSGLILGAWKDWLLHFWSIAFHSPLILRIPAALLVVAGWVGVRVAVGIALPLRSRDALVRVVLAAVYLAGAVSWLITLRPEPLVALLSVIVLISALQFVRRAGYPAIILGGSAALLAVTAHPTGLIALAPVIAVTPALVRWARHSRDRAVRVGAIGAAFAAIGLVVLLLDSDLGRMLDSVSLLRDFHRWGWTDEPLRYSLLGRSEYATPLRRLLAISMVLIPVLMFLTRASKRETSPRTVPGWSLVFSLLLLLLTPTKWPWHFGAIVAFAAVALAVEASEFSLERRRPLRVAFIGIVSVLGLALPWAVSNDWHLIDLGTLDWSGQFTFLDSPAVWAGVIGAGSLAFYVTMRRRAADPGEAAVRAGIVWAVPLAALIAIGWTGIVIVRDAVATPGWTMTTQNVRSLLGRADCGLAEQQLIAPSLPVGLPRAQLEDRAGLYEQVALDLAAEEAGFGAEEGFSPDWRFPKIDSPDLEIFSSFPPRTVADDRNGYEGTFRSDWYAVPDGANEIGVLVAGGGLPGLQVALQFAGADLEGTIQPIEAAGGDDGAYKVRVGAAPAGAREVRVLAADAAGGYLGWLQVSAPVALAGGERILDLAQYISSDDVKTLVQLPVGMFIPCATQPSIRGGVVEAPDVVIVSPFWWWPPNGVFDPYLDSLPDDYARFDGDVISVFVRDLELPTPAGLDDLVGSVVPDP